MHSRLTAFVVLFVATLTNSVLFVFRGYSSLLHWTVLFLLIVALLSLRGYWMKKTQPFFTKWGKWWFLFLASVIVPLAVLSTGSIFSPFLVLMHLSILGVGIFFGFFITLLFLLYLVVLLTLSIFVDPVVFSGIVQDPVSLVLYLLSFATLVPIVWLLTVHYRAKDKLYSLLQSQVKVEESIMQSLPELIFVTDSELGVLSVNESVIRVLHRGRSELLHRGLFEILYLKHPGGALMSPELLGLDKLKREKRVQEFDNLLLVATDRPVQKVRLTVTPVLDIEGNVEQLSFVLLSQTAYADAGESKVVLEQATVRQEALLENLKQKLASRGFMELWIQLLLLEKATDDISVTQTIQNHGIQSDTEIIDFSRLCNRIVQLEQGYARAFGANVSFSIVNLGWRVSESFQHSLEGKTEESTDPFFTVRCNVRYVSILIEKMVDLSVLLSTHAANAQIQFIVGAERSDLVVVWLRVSCPEVATEQLQHLLTQGYGEMRSWKNFQFGSGLEGYVAKTIATYLDLQLDVHYKQESQECIFTLQVPRNVQVQSSVGVQK